MKTTKRSRSKRKGGVRRTPEYVQKWVINAFQLDGSMEELEQLVIKHEFNASDFEALKMRFEGLTCAAIGKKLGLSGGRVEQKCNHVANRLRRVAGDHGRYWADAPVPAYRELSALNICNLAGAQKYIKACELQPEPKRLMNIIGGLEALESLKAWVARKESSGEPEPALPEKNSWEGGFAIKRRLSPRAQNCLWNAKAFTLEEIGVLLDTWLKWRHDYKGGRGQNPYRNMGDYTWLEIKFSYDEHLLLL